MLSPAKNQNLIFSGIIVGIYLLAWYMQSNITFNIDVSWLMHASERLLAGGTYAQDFFETNPPLILYINFPVVIFSKIFHIKMYLVLYVYIFLLATWCFGISYFFIKNIFSQKDAIFKKSFSITLLTVFLILPVADFGQRENLLVIFTMSYILMMVYRLQGNVVKPNLAIIIGLLAFLGFALKPYFLIVPVLVELYYAIKTKNLFAWMRIDIVAALSLLMIYLGAIFIFHPDYFSIVVPFVMRTYYQGILLPWEMLLLCPLAIFCYFPLLFHCVVYKKNPYKELSSVLCIVLIGFLIGHFMQRVNMYYHFLPALSIALLLFVLLFTLVATQQQTTKEGCILSIVFFIPFLLFFFVYWNYLWVEIVYAPKEFFCFFAILFAFLFYAGLQNKNLLKIVSYVFLIICLGYLFSYMIQRDSLEAHAFLLTTLLMLFLFVFFMQQSQINRYRYIAVVVLGMFIFSIPSSMIGNRYAMFVEHKKNLNHFLSFIQSTALHKSFYFFSSRFYAYPCVDYIDVSSGSRFPFFWMIPGLAKLNLSKNNDISQQAIKDEKFLIDMISDDIQRNKPYLVFVDVNKYKYFLSSIRMINHKPVYENIPFDYLPTFLKNENFQKAWKNYRFLTKINFQRNDWTDEFEVYERV